MTDTIIHCKVCKTDKASTEFYSGKTTCKDCNREARNKRRHDQKKEEGKEDEVFDDLEDFKTKYEKHLAEKGTRFAVLTRSMFKTDEDFTAAKQMQKQHRDKYQKDYKASDSQKEKDAKRHSDAYYQKKQEK